MLKNKRGTVRVHREFLFRSDSKVLSLLFSRFFPVHIDVMFDVYYYTGMSEDFEEFPEGSVAPFPKYEVIFTETGEGLTLKFERYE
jgi:hypothetical protein